MSTHRNPRPDRHDLAKFGPRFEIEVGPPIIRNPKGVRIPVQSHTAARKFSRMPALIDTGAGRTVLTPEAIRKLGLPVVDHTTLSRAGGLERVSAHVASIQFPRSRLAPIEVIQVLCCELPGDLFQCLIGRDVLSRWLFIYNGKTGEWSIEEEDLAVWVEPPEGLLT